MSVAGAHRLTIMVDNANRRTATEVDSGTRIPRGNLSTDVKPSARLNCGGHHIWSHDWNGILGRIEIRAHDDVWMLAVDVYPEIAAGAVRVRLRIANPTGARGSVRITATCAPRCGAPTEAHATALWPMPLTGEKEQRFEQHLRLADPVHRWDEFSPVLYELRLAMDGDLSRDVRQTTFGMRELRVDGTRMQLNGKRLFLRGTLECFIFPLNGHPPMDGQSWRRVLAIAKSYGLNCFRFHLCCPPEAAFTAADEMGFYLHVELPGTSCPTRDESREVEEFLTAELERILETYGNHPSFLTLSMGNEQLHDREVPGFLERHQEVLARKVGLARERDARHLYTSTSHPWSPGRVDDFFISAWPVSGDEPLRGIAWTGGRVVDCSRFNTRPPETVFDYAPGLRGLDRPLVTHEVGQWAVYPDLREISRYHGAQRAYNYEIIRERLRANGMREWAGDFTRASGMLSLLLYKEEIESALRTTELSGFMLLDIHDFPGQGTSPVGILNALWESKGLTTPSRFRAFCAPVVLLARIPKRVWTAAETFEAAIDLANYGPADVRCATEWSLSADGRPYAEGRLETRTSRQGDLTRLGLVSAELAGIPAPVRLTFRVEAAGVNANAWDVWLYPEVEAAVPLAGISVATRWDATAKEILQRGDSLLLVPTDDEPAEAIPGTFTPVFWNPQMKHLQPAKTMGLLCDPAHPALASFPTDFHSDWQWWDPVMRSAVLCLDAFPAALRPIVQVVDSFVGNRRLAMVFEARVGAGRLVVCSSDIVTDLAVRPVARQLRKSLLD